jgi:hypothetical protein
MDLARIHSRLAELQERNAQVRARAARTIARSEDLARRTALLAGSAQARALGDDARCPAHPQAGPGVLVAEAVDAGDRVILAACLQCVACGFTYVTREQALALERALASPPR